MARRDTVMKKPKDTRGALLRLLKYLGPWRYVILAVLILSLVSNLLNLWGPNLAGSAIREAAAGPGKVNFDRVTFYAGRMLLCYVGSALLGFGISLLMTVVSKRVARGMRQDVFDKLMRLPVGYFDRHQAGDIISRVSYDIDVISTCMATDIVQILSSVVTVVGSLIMMISISLPLSALTLVTVNPADVLNLKGQRGCLKENAFADINVYDDEMNLQYVFTEGRKAVWDHELKMKGMFEE